MGCLYHYSYTYLNALTENQSYGSSVIEADKRIKTPEDYAVFIEAVLKGRKKEDFVILSLNCINK